ncbi:MAG: TolC family protein [Cyanobacteria bacterium RUI128]|nr:TolC family protein [Cyanobacteria bacterium RUI128]
MRRNILLLIVFILSAVVFAPIVSAHEEGHCDCCTCHKDSKMPKEIKDGTVLTIQDCVSIGLKNSPVIKKRKYELDIAKSNVGIAKSVYFPTLGVGVGYGQTNNSNNKHLESVYRELPNVGASLNKMIWDFGRSSARIKMEEFFKIGAEYEFMDSVCSTVFDIKTRYYDLLKAESTLEAKQINYAINEKIISEMKQMVASGKTSKADLLNAQTQHYKIQLEILDAEDAVKNAKENLNNSMYFLNAPDYEIEETNSYDDGYRRETNPYKLVAHSKTMTYKAHTSKNRTIHPDFSYSQAVELAYKNSPDLKVLMSTKSAMEQSLLAIKRTYYPELSGNIGYNFINTKKFANNSLTMGVGLTSSLNPMEFKHSLKGGYAQVELAQTEIDKFKEDLYFQVRKSLNIVNKTYEQIPVAKSRLKVAADNLTETLTQYRAKQMDQLELLYARNEYAEAMDGYVDAIYNYNIALINLEISMHYHLIDLHDRTEHAMKYHDDDIIDNFNNIMDCDKHDKHK